MPSSDIREITTSSGAQFRYRVPNFREVMGCQDLDGVEFLKFIHDKCLILEDPDSVPGDHVIEAIVEIGKSIAPKVDVGQEG